MKEKQKRYFAVTSGIEEGSYIVWRWNKFDMSAAIYLELHDRVTGEFLESVQKNLLVWDDDDAWGEKYDEDGDPIELTNRQYKNELARAFEELPPDLIDFAAQMGIDEDEIDFESRKDQYDVDDPNDFYFD